MVQPHEAPLTEADVATETGQEFALLVAVTGPEPLTYSRRQTSATVAG